MDRGDASESVSIKTKTHVDQESYQPEILRIGIFENTFQMKGASVSGDGGANQERKKQPSLIGVHDPDTSKQCANKIPESAAELWLTQEHAKRPQDDQKECGAESDAAAGEVHSRPPGLDSPRQGTVRAVWLVERDPEATTWRPMNNVLCDHIEGCWKRGLSATAVEQNGEHHYYDLKQMCRYNAKTGIGCRIQRMVVEQ